MVPLHMYVKVPLPFLSIGLLRYLVKPNSGIWVVIHSLYMLREIMANVVPSIDIKNLLTDLTPVENTRKLEPLSFQINIQLRNSLSQTKLAITQVCP